MLTWDVTGTTGTSGSGVASAPVTGVSGSAMSAAAGTTAGNISGGVTSPANSWNRTYVLYADAASAQAANSFITWTTTVSDTYTLTISGFTGLTLAKTSTAGPTSAELYYSTDGTTFTKVGGTATVTSALTSAAATFAPSSPIVINGAAGGTVVTWRLVGYGAAGRMGIANAGTDNFSILGTVTGGAAKNLVWPGGSGEWTGANAWLDGSTPTTFAANDNVTINGGSITVSNAVSSGSVAVGGSSATTLSGSGITGTTLTKSGSGTLTLAMANTFSGGVSATGGTVTVAANGALGAGSLSLNGATLAVSDPAVTAVANSASVGTSDASISVASGAAFGMNGVVSALGTTAGVARGDSNSFNVLNKSGAGVLTFSNTFGTQMSYDTTTKLLTTAGALQLNIAAGGSVAFNGVSKTMNLGSGTSTDTYDTNTVPPTPITVYNGMVWDGDFYLQAGTVQINGGNIRGAGKIYVTNTGGTFAQRLNFNSPDIDNNVDVATGSTLTLSAASSGSIKFNGQLTGSGTVANTGSGGASLNNTNPSTFSGTFNVAQTSASSSSRMTVKAQTLASATGVNFLSGQAGLPKMTIENSTTTSGAVVACPISGPGELTKAYDGDILLTAENTFSGGLVLQDAGTVYVTNPNSLGVGPLVAGGVDGRIGLAASAQASEMTITNDVNTWIPVVRTNITTNGAVVVTNVTTTLYIMAFSPGSDTNGAARSIRLDSLVTNSGLLKVSGGGNLFVNNTGNTYTGGTEIGTGSVIISNASVLSTGPVNFGTTTNSFLRFSADMTLTNPVTVSGVSTNSTNVIKYTANFTVDAGLTATLTGGIGSKGVVGTDQKYGARAEKWGAGKLVLSASNDLAESLTVNEGTLDLAASNAVSAVTGVRCAGGTLLLSYSGEMNAGDLSVEANTVLNMGSPAARSVHFASLASTFSSNAPVYLTVTNTANGSIYFPTNTSASRLQQIKSAEQPTYVASVDGTTGLLSFGAPKQDQTITFGSLPAKTVADAPFQLTATASSGLTVSYTSSNTNVATVAGNTVTLVAEGTTTITASQAGDSSYNAAAPVAQILVVNAAPASGYDAWTASYGLSGANAATTADPDGDGFNNNSEYAFGTNPTAANGALLSTTNSGGNLTVSWIQRNSGLSYNVQSTAALAIPFANDGTVTVTDGSQTGVPSGYTRKQFTVATSGAKFYRIKATP